MMLRHAMVAVDDTRCQQSQGYRVGHLLQSPAAEGQQSLHILARSNDACARVPEGNPPT
jgi:hypothetical protein